MRRIPLALSTVAAVSLLSACGNSPGAVECLNVALRPGIGVDIDPAFAPRVDSAAMKACWDGDCRTFDLKLEASTAASALPCTGNSPTDVCGAQAVPTGGKYTFAEVRNLPGKPIDITLSLAGPRMTPPQDQHLTVTPRTANVAPQCAGDQRQAGIIVSKDGTVSERR
ncbi:hypothetical protein EV192_112190 [Actinocrispum wychmicini]|uniref:Uncharacterized protein n=2 Tax=Actinocrispum wychmicini TaxID=1213861 RepID=A0A4R2J7F6_9PSEU|nr:hypothetical protein EV192_112190 [Actinocrispum wychmicini]